MATKVDRKYGVSIITCTNRPRFFKNIIKNYRNQRYLNKELIIILNKDSMSLSKYRGMVLPFPNVSVYKVSEEVSLGRCLNRAIRKARYPLITKFDDDDYYSPYYLREQVKALFRKHSDVVGKHACLVYLGETKELIIRSPAMRNRFVTLVQGGTILFRRPVFNKVRFADTSLGEDVQFLRTCRRRGFKVYATSPYNYVYMRRKNKETHTWQADDNHYLEGSQAVAKTRDYRRYAIRKVKW